MGSRSPVRIVRLSALDDVGPILLTPLAEQGSLTTLMAEAEFHGGEPRAQLVTRRFNHRPRIYVFLCYRSWRIQGGSLPASIERAMLAQLWWLTLRGKAVTTDLELRFTEELHGRVEVWLNPKPPTSD